jgi:hypothetical protein
MSKLDFERFLNLTELETKDAEEKVSEYRDMVQNAEGHLSKKLERAERNFEIYKNQIWDDEDLTFFQEIGVTPYQFSIARPLINNLIARQRNRRFSFEIVPRDTQAYRRFENGKQAFVANHLNEFNTPQEAEEYYDEYADDEYARVINALLSNVRYESKAPWKESENFQSGLVTGGDFMKATMSRKNNTSGSVNIERKSQRQIVYDPMAIEYDLSDAEFIGEVHQLYVDDLVQQYPEHAELIQQKFKIFTNKGRNRTPMIGNGWADWFKYDEGESNVKIKVMELWVKETEERLMLLDNETGEQRLLLPGVTLEDVIDQKAAEMLQMAIQSGMVDLQNTDEDIQEKILEQVNQRYTVNVVFEPVWYKCVFAMGSLFEYKRSPYPHNSHPYTPFWAQHADGYTTGLIDDIYDIIIAANKALAFRELMMAHSSKGLVIIDEKAFADAGYSVADVAEAYTQIGSVLAIKPKPGKSVNDLITQLTTVGDGINAINAVIADYDNRLYQISGVNLAQLGVTQGETPASRFRMQIAEGENNNALIFDNFVRSMEQFYNEKVIPLVVEMAKSQKEQVVRMLGDDSRPWVAIDMDPDEGLFADTLRSGVFSCVLVPKEDNPQLDEARSAKYMELAMAGAIPIEVAIESSNDPNRQRIVKKIRQWKHQQMLDQAKNQVDLQLVMQVMMQSNVDQDTADDIIKNIRLQNMQNQNKQSGSPLGTQNISEAAAQPQRLQTIQNNTINGIQ